MRQRWFVVCFFALLISIAPLLGQNATTSLRGTVTDSTGAALPNVAVKLSNASIGFTTATVSGSHGEYAFQQLAPGDYVVTFSAPDFGDYTVRAALQVAQPATVNAKLGVVAKGVTVEIQANTQALNTTDASIGNVIDNQQIMQLPSLGREVTTLLALQPGVLYLGSQSNADSRSGAVSGARPDQTNITLDGLDNNDQIFPTAFQGALRTSLDAIEEFRVTTSNANSDTGRSSGGQVNMVTRSGSNVLHGAIYDYNRSSIGEANDWFNKAGQIQSGLANRPPPLNYNVFGARLGGPIVKDKLFLFGSYEGDRENQAQAVTRTVPTASLRAGILKYTGTSGVVTLTPAQVASMDTNCSGLGTCPQGPGDNPASLALFKTYPAANGSLTGDGQNFASYTFSSPLPLILNVYTARLDYALSDKHRFYVRGSFQNDTSSGAQWLPGQPASTKSTVDSRGISGNYTWSISSSKVNNLRYGFINQSYASTGAGSGNYVTFRGLDLPESSARSSKTTVPLHNIIDDFTLSFGRHTIEVGANFRRYTYQNNTNANSFNTAAANPNWLVNAGIAGKSGFAGATPTLDPVNYGFPDVVNTTNYDYAISALAGLVDEQTNNYNYLLSADGKTATSLGAGTPVSRSFRSNELEYYVQDTYKPVSNVTVTLGLRHTIQQTPWETNGQQVQPTININDWFNTRAANALLGKTVQPDISFAPAGQFRGGKPFYPMNWGNFAPRFAIAYSPGFSEGFMNKIFGGAGHSSIRAGFGMYYDHFGQGLVANYSRRGSFSLSSSLSNPASSLNADTTPRFTGLHNLPTLIPAATSTISYPQTPSDDPNGTGFAITNGLDDRIQSPYAEAFNLSWQRDLGSGFSFEAAYVGRLGRHLLQSRDLAQPLDLVDPGSHRDYYTAATALAKAADAGAVTVATDAYWENLFPQAKTSTESATQVIYENEFQPGRGNETQSLVDIDLGCSVGCPSTGRYWDSQYSSLFVTSAIGTSSYNSGQFILRHAMKHGVQFDLSYTYSKSLDLGSDSEANAINTAAQFGFILDAFNPRKNWAASDFDTRHLITGDWVLNVPTGRGQRFGGNVNRLTDAFIGGWNISGIARASSGLPWTIYDGAGWGTNWEWESAVVQTGPIKMRKHLDADGSPQVFDDPLAARANMRLPYPGEAGERNKFRADGYFTTDMGLHKTVHFTDRIFAHFAWEVFNVTNSARFDAHSVDSGSEDQSTLGIYSTQLTGARKMQLSARIEF
jgi:hypothetical protein